MRRLSVPFTLLAILVAAGSAEAVSVRDVIELTHARLSEAIILELIAVDQTIYSLDAARIVELREAGVSERVILAMIRSGRNTPAPVAGQTPAPQQTREGAVAPTVVIIERRRSTAALGVGTGRYVQYGAGTETGGTADHVRDGYAEGWRRRSSLVVPVPVFGYPWYGQTQSVSPASAGLDTAAGFGRFMNDGYRPAQTVQPDAAPVYWGWGGQLRPGAWTPAK